MPCHKTLNSHGGPFCKTHRNKTMQQQQILKAEPYSASMSASPWTTRICALEVVWNAFTAGKANMPSLATAWAPGLFMNWLWSCNEEGSLHQYMSLYLATGTCGIGRRREEASWGKHKGCLIDTDALYIGYREFVILHTI
jgi:hypothetical protein